jgi:ribose/xylose/arabinose/galactoside ABC-type transport system permease subunit
MKLNNRQNHEKTVAAKAGTGYYGTVGLSFCASSLVFEPQFFWIKTWQTSAQIAPIQLSGIGCPKADHGNIDLSIGSVVCMSCMNSATLMTKA